jgi:hypothetical protein
MFQKAIFTAHTSPKQCMWPDSPEMGVWIEWKISMKKDTKIYNIYIINLKTNNFEYLFWFLRREHMCYLM